MTSVFFAPRRRCSIGLPLAIDILVEVLSRTLERGHDVTDADHFSERPRAAPARIFGHRMSLTRRCDKPTAIQR
jgi:hypothetical protein